MSRESLSKTLGITIILAVALSGCAFENLGKTEVVTVDPETHFMEVFDEETLNYTDGTKPAAKGEESEESENSEEGDSQYYLIDYLDYDNDYMEEVPVGDTCQVDLNLDGTLDTVYYNATRSNIAEYGTAVESFTINGGDFKYTLFLSDQGIHIQDPNLVSYYITDIDTRDRYREVAILDYGANGTPYTYFIRYTGTGTYCLGYVPYFPGDEYFVIKGNGQVESAYDLHILQTWKAPATWTAGSDQQLSSNFKMYKNEILYPYEDQNTEPVTQLIDLYLYKTRSTSGEQFAAPKSDSEVTFTQTDDSHWVYMKRADNVEGWFYMENSDTIVSNGKKYNRRDVFKNLY